MKKFLLALFVCLYAFSAQAMQVAQIDNIGEELSYKQISSELLKIEKLTKAEKLDIDAMVKSLPYLNDMSMQLDGSRKDIAEEIKRIEKRIEALGIVDQSLPEAKVIVQKRKEFHRELGDERTRLSEIDILSTKIDELNLVIFDIRNQMLWGNLLNSEGSFMNPKMFFKVNRELITFGLDIIKSPYAWYSNLSQNKHDIIKDNIIAVILFLTLISFVGYLLRNVIIRKWGYGSDIELPRLGRKIIAAFAVWCAYGIIPTAIIGFCLYWLLLAGMTANTLLGIILSNALYYLLYIIMGRASFRVVFTPYNEKWRLINMPTDKAKKMIRAIYFTIAITGIFSFLQHVISLGGYSIELLSYILAISSILKSICILWLAHVYFASEEVEIQDNLDDDDTYDEKEGKAFQIGMFISIFVLIMIGLSLFGYARLASFIINRSILSTIVIVVFSIMRRLIYDLIQHVLLMGLWIKTFKMRRIFLRKIDFWFGIIAEPLLMLLLLGCLLLLWGVPFDILQSTVYKLISGFMIGGVRISIISIFWGILVFSACLWLIKFIRYRIEFKLLEKTSIDAGTKHSLASGFAYIGYVLAGLLSIAIMGGNLTNIALIAGALSVGIGLGLQDVVNNFVSGIIMLIERPIKVGDWVIINGEEGKIKQINIRSTELETFTRQSVIIPNAKVLSNSVTNLTHQNNWVRYSINIGVAYGSDVERVKNLLLECVAMHSKVAKKPAPYVIFKDFGASSLDFEVRFYVSDIWTGFSAPSDIRYIIYNRFNQEGIEIPFNQLVIYNGDKANQEKENQPKIEILNEEK